MRDDRQIDGRQHGLPRAVVDRFTSEQNLFVTLRDHTKTQVVDTVQGFAWRPAAMERERRNGSAVVAVGLGKTRNGASQGLHRRRLGRVSPRLLGHERPSAALRIMASLDQPVFCILVVTIDTSF